jgi:hypothetical protein
LTQNVALKHRVYKKRGRYIFRIIIVVVIITREEKQGKSTSRIAPLSYSLSFSLVLPLRLSCVFWRARVIVRVCLSFGKGPTKALVVFS